MRSAIHRRAGHVVLIAMGTLNILQIAMWTGAGILEGFPNMSPNIPDPTAGPGTEISGNEIPGEAARTLASGLSERVIVYVHPVNLQRFAETVNRDVARHGGWSIQHDRSVGVWTLAAPRGYLKRMGLLTADSGANPQSAAYQDWAWMVHRHPVDASISGPAAAAVSLQLNVPIITNQATKTLMWWTGVPSLIAMLGVLAGLGMGYLAAPSPESCSGGKQPCPGPT